MAVGVERRKSRVTFSDEEWEAILEVARRHGWTSAVGLPRCPGEGSIPRARELSAEEGALPAGAITRAPAEGRTPGSPPAGL